jgi:TonB family protein
MKPQRRWFQFLLMIVLGGAIALGQDSSALLHLRYHSLRDTVKTGATLDNTHYYLKLVPADTTHKDRMSVNPELEYETGVIQPVPVKQVNPEYPKEAKRLNIEGTVWVKCLVDNNGSVKKAEVLKADAKLFIEPAIDAAKQWKFTPAQRDGKPVETWVTIPFRFRLEK